MTDIVSAQVTLAPENAHLVTGIHDAHITLLEDSLGVSLLSRGNTLVIRGDETSVSSTLDVIQELETLVARSQVLTQDAVQRVIDLHKKSSSQAYSDVSQSKIVSYRGRNVSPNTPGQREYVDAIDENTVVFGLGPAGTGKTYLAMAKAVEALNNKEVSRIILTRPAVEAGEKLGFLPGTLNEKIDPYLRPLHDALRDMVGPESIPRMMETGIIEVAPLAYMRGRTLNNAFVILDEAQNTTPAQMKMFLTRLGFGSKFVITGDLSQVDLPGSQKSGLGGAEHILGGVDGVYFNHFASDDVVRHHLVGRIVDAYDDYEAAYASSQGTHKTLRAKNPQGTYRTDNDDMHFDPHKPFLQWDDEEANKHKKPSKKTKKK